MDDNLDLAKILRELAKHSSQPQAPPPDASHVPHQSNGYEQHARGHGHEHQPLPQHRHTHTPPTSRPQITAGPVIDPSTITEWKHGLRCVNKKATDPNFVSSIRKLIKEQERHVKEWDDGRKRLIKEQEAKRESEKVLRAAISLPGFLDTTPTQRTTERDQAELDQYYQKVYRASRQMTESHTKQLAQLGVPFFGLRSDLLRPDDDDDSSLLEVADAAPTEESDGTITKKQLLALQRKMLNHLVELYGD